MDDGSGSSNTWKYVGIGCGIAALLSICAVGGCIACGAAGIGGIVAATEAPATAAHGFFSDVRGHDLAHAYGRMSDTYRATHPQATFEAGVLGTPGLPEHTDATFNNRSINAATATLSGTLSSPSGTLPVSISLHDAGGGSWLIDSVTVSGRPL